MITAGGVFLFLRDVEYIREGREFRAQVWIMYLLFGAVSCTIMGFVTKKVAFPIIPSFVILASVNLHFIGGIFDLYHSVVFWDHITHGLTHFGTALIVYFFFLEAEDNGNMTIHPLLLLLIGGFVVIGGGALFEIREYAFSFIFHTIDQGGYHNTLGDLMYNAIGVAFAMVLVIMGNTTYKGNGEKKKRYSGQRGTLLYISSVVALFIIFVFIRISQMKMERFDQFETSAYVFVMLLNIVTAVFFIICSYRMCNNLVAYLPFVDKPEVQKQN